MTLFLGVNVLPKEVLSICDLVEIHHFFCVGLLEINFLFVRVLSYGFGAQKVCERILVESLIDKWLFTRIHLLVCTKRNGKAFHNFAMFHENPYGCMDNIWLEYKVKENWMEILWINRVRTESSGFINHLTSDILFKEYYTISLEFSQQF